MTRLAGRSWPLDFAGPLAALLPPRGGLAWLQGDDGLVAWGRVRRLDVGAAPERIPALVERFRALAEAAEIIDPVEAPGSGLIGFGSLSFDPQQPGSVFTVPEVVVGRRDGRSWVTRIGEAGRALDRPSLDPRPVDEARGTDRPRFAGSSIPDVHWLEAVADAVRRIEAGELEKVVLARDHALWAREPFDPRILAVRLNRRFPGCLTFSIDGLIGATPELLVRRVGGHVESLALAGTAARGTDAGDDARRGEQLLASKKDRWEHELAAMSVREVLAPRCGHFEHAPEPQLLRLDNVMHLATRFEGRLLDPATDDALTLAGALHPTAAVGGHPTTAALAVIAELEGMTRGRYAGPVGWLDGDGDGEWGIALRCAELSGARARLFAGAGIVRGSLPEDELEETRIKLQAMRGVLGSGALDTEVPVRGA